MNNVMSYENHVNDVKSNIENLLNRHEKLKKAAEEYFDSIDLKRAKGEEVTLMEATLEVRYLVNISKSLMEIHEEMKKLHRNDLTELPQILVDFCNMM